MPHVSSLLSHHSHTYIGYTIDLQVQLIEQATTVCIRRVLFPFTQHQSALGICKNTAKRAAFILIFIQTHHTFLCTGLSAPHSLSPRKLSKCRILLPTKSEEWRITLLIGLSPWVISSDTITGLIKQWTQLVLPAAVGHWSPAIGR